MVRLAFAVAAILATTLPASAQSFNCRHAATPTEAAVCNSDQLMQMDEIAVGEYLSVHSLAWQIGGWESAERIKAEQVAFLKLRNLCRADFMCILGAYESRLARLRDEENDYAEE